MLSRDSLAAHAEEAGLEPSAVILRRLDSPGFDIEIDSHRQFYPASMIKTPLALAACSAVHDGSLRFDDRFEVTQANMTHNDGPSPLVAGYQATLTELIDLITQDLQAERKGAA